MGTFLAAVGGIGALICFVLVLIKLFNEKGALHGILGILCGLYPFIWGWMNVGRLNIRNIMLLWTACAILAAIFGSSFSFDYSAG
ncbi:MAG: hypothetical protein H8D34_15280 [Chloroflexi bacterium]|nr:hypothetical protein [Chloroflexota bacterium]